MTNTEECPNCESTNTTDLGEGCRCLSCIGWWFCKECKKEFLVEEE